MKLQILPFLLLGLLSSAPVWAQTATASADSDADSSTILPIAPSARAVVDMRYACEWLAYSYEVPVRVPQEILLAGYSYSDAMIALSMMHKGASLNELLELRRNMRWEQVAAQVEIDPQTLPLAVRGLLYMK